MTFTRATLESILLERTLNLLTFAGMEITAEGQNKSFNDPIGYALRQAGYTVANPALVTNADCAALDDDYFDQVLDVAEYRTLKNILGNLTKVDTSVGPYSESLSQIMTNLEKRMARLAAEIQDDYGVGDGVTIETGTINYDIALHGDDE